MTSIPEKGAYDRGALEADLEELRGHLDETCAKIAARFDLYFVDGNPRKATIIEVLAKSDCISCIRRKFELPSKVKGIDSFYSENHSLVVSILTEELYSALAQMGYRVSLATEAQSGYGKVDVLLETTLAGLSLKSNGNKIIVEAKTGGSMSWSQIFRYMLEGECDSVILWRVKNKQVLSISRQDALPLLSKFVRAVTLRGNRVLSEDSPKLCDHEIYSAFKPTAEDLESTFRDLSAAVDETLPDVIKTCIEKLDLKGSSQVPLNEAIPH
ncbi:MAG: hypothetical protein ABSF36_03180 [Candidatus Methanomethylicaceae archaeon]|jgi:hypothetical protein